MKGVERSQCFGEFMDKVNKRDLSATKTRLRCILFRVFTLVLGINVPNQGTFNTHQEVSPKGGGRPVPSTIGVSKLNFCVRYGNRCITHAIITILYFLDLTRKLVFVGRSNVVLFQIFDLSKHRLNL